MVIKEFQVTPPKVLQQNNAKKNIRTRVAIDIDLENVKRMHPISKSLNSPLARGNTTISMDIVLSI